MEGLIKMEYTIEELKEIKAKAKEANEKLKEKKKKEEEKEKMVEEIMALKRSNQRIKEGLKEEDKPASDLKKKAKKAGSKILDYLYGFKENL